MHRAEQILEAAVAALTGLPLVGANVYRGRATDEDALQDLELPALLVNQGADELRTELSHDRADYDLGVNVDIVVADVGVVGETLCNAIRREATIALATDHRLGLDFVETIKEAGALEPALASRGDRSAAFMRAVWVATYRRGRIDPGN